MIHDMTIFGIHLFVPILFGLNFFEIVGILTVGWFLLLFVLLIMSGP